MDTSKHGAEGIDEEKEATSVKPLPGAILVPIGKVRRDPNQPRRDWRANDGHKRLNELTKSVQEFGILQPLLVRQEGAHYIVIAGGRRLVAAQRAGMTEIPVVVRNDDNAAHVRVLQLVENIQRHQLAALDEARAFQELIDLDGMTPPQIALRVRVSEQYVRDRLRILRDQMLSDAVERRQIAMSVAREINKLSDMAADRLRQRIAAGEKIQMSDIREMRRQLAAAGIVNPRMSPRTDRPVPDVSTAKTWLDTDDMLATSGPHVIEPAELPAWLEQTGGDRAGRTVQGALQEIEQGYRLYRLTAAINGTGSHSLPLGNPGLNEARADTDAVSGATLGELLAGLDRKRLEKLLLFALDRGWNIPGLLQILCHAGA